jgi:hypothetical protein
MDIGEEPGLVNTGTGPLTPSVGRWLRFSAWLGRLWRGFVAFFSPQPEPMPIAPVSPAPPPPPPPPPPGQLRGRRRLQTPLVVPASGYIFTFEVHATFIWMAEGIYQEELSSAIDGLMPYVTRRLKALAAQRRGLAWSSRTRSATRRTRPRRLSSVITAAVVSAH